MKELVSEFRAGLARIPSIYRAPYLDTVSHAAPPRRARVVAQGKFFLVEGEKFYVRGVTYGPFRPASDGCAYKTLGEVDRDFSAMAAAGFNTVRTYTAVPTWLLDRAQHYGLKVLVGISWPQLINFLDTRKRRDEIVATVRDTVRKMAGHPAVLGYTLGNEIPAAIVRWYGAARIEQFIRRLYDAAKDADPDGLVTYANYPTTEYLQLPFLDFSCYNVYLDAPKNLAAYVARLQNLSEEKPLVLSELGIDSERAGTEKQAASLEWQLRVAYAGGCAGVCVFSWTDEWFRLGHDIDGWSFGLTDRARRPKPALDSVSRALRAVPFPADVQWPRVSIVVCTYNGARYIRQTCESLARLDYPNYEVIVVSDGSTDETLDILADFDFNVVSVQNGGLSRARNLGLQMATGEIVAYLDDDAYPDEHWLKYLAWSFHTTRHAGIGGPNFPPADDEFWALCVAHSPGGPNHVLLADDLAEHIPGCNMAFRRSALENVGGFDREFRIAGDDVDLCWRIQEQGGTLGFSPSAVVWHHRRNSPTAYLRQQYNYGRAEGMLAAKWPEKFNAAGHVKWGGRIYGFGRATPPFGQKVAVFQGTWGTAPFQSMYEKPAGPLTWLTMMPEWHLFTAVLALVSLAGFAYRPLFVALLLLVPALAASVAQAVRGASVARIPRGRVSTAMRWCARVGIGLLHYLQPLTRLRGRMKEGLRPRYFKRVRASLTGFGTRAFWHESRVPVECRMAAVEKALHRLQAKTYRGGDYDHWDLEVCGGTLGRARVLMAVEEHGAGRQLIRFRIEPCYSPVTRSLMAITSMGMLALTLLEAQGALVLLSTASAGMVIQAMMQSLSAAGAFQQAASTAAIGNT